MIDNLNAPPGKGDGRWNGNRQHWYFSKPGSSYGGNVPVVGKYKGKTIFSVNVGNGSLRTEQGLPDPSDDVVQPDEPPVPDDPPVDDPPAVGMSFDGTWLNVPGEWGVSRVVANHPTLPWDKKGTEIATGNPVTRVKIPAHNTNPARIIQLQVPWAPHAKYEYRYLSSDRWDHEYKSKRFTIYDYNGFPKTHNQALFRRAGDSGLASKKWEYTGRPG